MISRTIIEVNPKFSLALTLYPLCLLHQ